MKVYIVTSGFYSDYEIEAVFTTEENAKAYIDKHGDYNNREIEEYDADVVDLKRETAVYAVYIDKDESVAKKDNFSKPDTIKVSSMDINGNFHYYYRYVITVETDSAERAKKIASERLMQVKAMPYLFPRLYEKCVGYKLLKHTMRTYPTYNFHTKEIVLEEGEFLKE